MPRKLTTKDFIEKARAVHGDKYEYSKVEYLDSKTKVIITCPIHGDFEQTPNSHLNGTGCPRCGHIATTSYKTSNTKEFIEKAQVVHGDKYDYFNVEYRSTHKKVIINCPVHGDFEQSPHSHLRGRGCHICGHILSTSNQTSNTKEFIEKARMVHGDKYDYSKVEYRGSKTKVIIICPIHGDFEQSPKGHLSSHGCPECGRIATTSYNMVTTEEFIEKARVVHGDKYDYSNIEYFDSTKKVIITCPIHGDFEQSPHGHLSGCGCPRCSGNVKLSTKEFIEKARMVHGGIYDYSNVEYINTRNKVIIICPIHGDFEQSPNSHLSGHGCSHCNRPRTSYGKMTVEQRQRIKDVYTYHLRFQGNGELFDKIGISGDLPKRIKNIQNNSKKAYRFVSGYARKFDNAHIAYEMEYKLLENFQLTNDNKYTPKIPFGGDTECIIPCGNPTMFDSTCIPERSDRFNYHDYLTEF